MLLQRFNRYECREVCKVSIPQAVGVVATATAPVDKKAEFFLVSIPRAVGVVATS